MRIEDAYARKAYIQSVRKSFDDPERKYEWEYPTDTKGEANTDSFSFFKVRLLIAVFIFAAYILCDKTNTMFYQYSTKEVAQKIAENYDYSQIKDEVMQVFNQIIDME